MTQIDDFLAPEPLGPYLHRYLSLAKFVDLLETRTLFLCPASHLPDKTEGLKYSEREQIEMAALRQALSNMAGHTERAIQGVQRHLELEAKTQEFAKKLTFVSCWHTAVHESYAMWKVYVPESEGVLIRTTRSRLEEVVQRAKAECPSAKVEFADVRYGPSDPSRPLELFFRKRQEYEYEHETRLVVSLSR